MCPLPTVTQVGARRRDSKALWVPSPMPVALSQLPHIEVFI